MSMRNISKLISICWLVGLAFTMSCSKDDENPCVQAGGPIVTDTRMVDNFHSIEAVWVGNIYLTQGTSQVLEIVTHENILNLITTTVANGVLDLQLTGCTQGDLDLDVFITVPELRGVSLSGVGDIIGQTDFQTDNLAISLEGVGNVNFSGQANSFDLSISGVGNVSAFGLTAETCTIVISGSGDVEVTATNQLDVTISGTGNVYYKGNPMITSSISGSGSVIDSN